MVRMDGITLLPEIKCPRCGKKGSGLHVKWVLNEQKKKYEPYYWVAHSKKRDGEFIVKWCYIRKKKALAILERMRRKKS